MPKNCKETYQEYRDRLINPISPSFCAAKWYNATIWLGAGITASCHHPPGHTIPLSELEQDHRALHNTKHKMKMREQMQKGIRPKECEYCWRIEDMGLNHVSDRVFKTEIYTDTEILDLKESSPNDYVALKTLEISFDRTCNFACSYCNPGYSSTWVKDIRNNGPYQNLKSDGRKHFTNTNDWGQKYSANENNPYLEAFWKWWPELSKTLMELRVTGGEPTLSPHFWRLLDWFIQHESNHIRFALNTNLSCHPIQLEKLIQMSHQIKHFDLYTSCEASGSLAEYLRDGLNYANWKSNLETCIEDGKFERIVIMMTVNALSVFGITEFMDEILELKTKYGRDFPNLSLNILRFPSFQSMAVLPAELKQIARSKLSHWFEINKSRPEFHQMEVDSIARLISYLGLVKTSHSKSSKNRVLRKDFKSFYQQYDLRRGKNFVSANHKDLADWYESIDANRNIFENLISR